MTKTKMTEKEKQVKAQFLKAESIDDRTKRVLNPRINRVRKSIHDLTKAVNSPRYKFSDEQAEKLIEALTEDLNNLESAISGASEKEVVKDIL